MTVAPPLSERFIAREQESIAIRIIGRALDHSPIHERSMLVIAVRLDIHPEYQDEFPQHILDSAAKSLSNEPGCKRYEPSFSEDGSACFVYEIYADREAFEAHLQTDHFHAFDKATKKMIAEARVEEYELAAIG